MKSYSLIQEFVENYETDGSSVKEEEIRLELESQNIWARLRVLLEKNFPNDSKYETEMKLRTLRNNDFEDKTLELYVPEFQGSILRVGICVKGENKKAYFPTEIGEKLEELLSN